ncbi:hypothetical protein ROHU_017338 [Labeo rohita]|uniref:Uncharacterized protein n=1 Tax=Labeo rohita TaxID=84645 RepID=A0A498NGR7_LABRO|nr:hypothetical protein ROHU_017338 [Labeo rohita]
MLRNSSINAAVSLALLPTRPAISRIKEKKDREGRAGKKADPEPGSDGSVDAPWGEPQCASALACLIPHVTFLMDNKLRAYDSDLNKHSSRP